MSVTADIVASWFAPRQAFRRQLAAGRREDRALAYLMLACGLIFISALPQLARQAAANPEVPLTVRLGGAMLAWLGLMPLAFYGVAALSQLVLRLAGARGGFFPARLALFWALLAAAPVWLAQAAASTMLPPETARWFAALALALTLYIWLCGLVEAGWGKANGA